MVVQQIGHFLARATLCALLIFSVFISDGHADDRTPANVGKLLFEDTFSRAELGDAWQVHPNSFRIVDGVLIAAQRPDADHGAVSQTLVDFSDVVLQFSFLLDGGQGFNLVIDDRDYKKSHAGHICRVTVREKRIALQDDKTGAMRNDIFAMRRDPKTRKQADALMVGKSKAVAAPLERGQWHTMRVTIVGPRMRVELDGKPLATLESEGIAHSTKTDFGFTVLGRSVRFDNISAWAPH